MKTRDMLMIFALTSALSVASASTLRPAGTGAASGSPTSIAAVQAVQLPVLGLLQESPPPVQPAPEKKDVDVTVKTETTQWFVSPVWVAIGILAAIVLVLIIAMAMRGGDRETTHIVHD